ncbi:hypothetical protein [Evansella tamaricis]|nr:hypothetical protein [Evansella tamaricis]
MAKRIELNCPNEGSVRTTGEEPEVELSELGASSDNWRREWS